MPVWHRWQGGEPQAADTYFWLANAYRLVYRRSLWQRIQNHLLSLERFDSCRRTCELIRSHRRADRRVHPSIEVTMYTACHIPWALHSAIARLSVLLPPAVLHAAASASLVHVVCLSLTPCVAQASDY